MVFCKFKKALRYSSIKIQARRFEQPHLIWNNFVTDWQFLCKLKNNNTFTDKPSPPQGPLEATGMTETSCTIAWRPPADDGGTPLLDYTVQRKETSKRSWQSMGTVSETSLHMTDLVLNTPYNFRITARNKEGDSEPYVSEDPIIAGRKISKALCLLKYGNNTKLVIQALAYLCFAEHFETVIVIKPCLLNLFIIRVCFL